MATKATRKATRTPQGAEQVASLAAMGPLATGARIETPPARVRKERGCAATHAAPASASRGGVSVRLGPPLATPPEAPKGRAKSSQPAGAHARATTGVRQRFGELRALLAEGWEVAQPIFARPLWSAPNDSALAFNFVLRRERMTRLLTVPEGRTVQRFIREREFLVDYRG